MRVASVSGITAAVANQVTPTAQLNAPPARLTAQFNFPAAAGGTNVTAYLQTSFDNEATWCDIAAFQATTSAFRRIFNLSGRTSVTSIATPGDGALTVNTAIDGILGSKFRVKYTSTGTYTGGGAGFTVDIAAENQPS